MTALLVAVSKPRHAPSAPVAGSSGQITGCVPSAPPSQQVVAEHATEPKYDCMPAFENALVQLTLPSAWLIDMRTIAGSFPVNTFVCPPTITLPPIAAPVWSRPVLPVPPYVLLNVTARFAS